MGEAATTPWTIGDEIRRARKHARMDQATLAEAVGVSRQTVSSWECDRTEPSITEYRRIAQATGADWLLAQNWKQMSYGRHLALVPPILGQLELELDVEGLLSPEALKSGS